MKTSHVKHKIIYVCNWILFYTLRHEIIFKANIGCILTSYLLFHIFLYKIQLYARMDTIFVVYSYISSIHFCMYIFILYIYLYIYLLIYIANHRINTEIYKNIHVLLKIMHFKLSTLMLNYICL